MKNVVATSVMLFAAVTTTTALAITPRENALNSVKWCEQNTSAPAQTWVMAMKMPDGKLRGTRSAAELIGEARASARGGDNDKAIRWAEACQAHEPANAGDIGNYRDVVLRYLRGDNANG